MTQWLIWITIGLTVLAIVALFRGLYLLIAAEFGVQIDERLLGPAWRELQKRRQAEKGTRLWERVLAQLPIARGVDRHLEQAHVALTPSEWVAIWLLVTLATASMGYLLTQTWITALLMGILGFLLPPMWLNRRIEQRRAAFADQLIDTLRLMISALQAGHGLLQAVQLVAEEMPPPTSEEFAQVVREVGLGYSMNEALRRLGERMANDELDMVITAINIQNEVGGSLSEILENIAETIEERIRLQGEIRAITAQQRMSALLITALPFILALIISVISPGYLNPMFEPGWRWLPLSALFMMGIGQLLMRRMLRVDY